MSKGLVVLCFFFFMGYIHFFLQTIHVSFGHVVKLLQEDSVKISSQPQYTWGNLLHRMFSGELIYPWVETSAKSVKT